MRSRVKYAIKDYEVKNDLDHCAEMLRNGSLLSAVESELGTLN